MTIYYRSGDTRFDLEKLSINDLITIQDATGKMWHQAFSRGTLVGDLKVAKAVIEQCAKRTNTPTPDFDVININDLLGGVFEVDDGDNRPSEFTDGMPDPKAPGSEPETTG